MKLLSIEKVDKKVKVLHTIPKTLVCFSHLRWDFVFQRPQHLLTRLASKFNIYFIEEPLHDATSANHYELSNRGENIVVMVPHIQPGLNSSETTAVLKTLFDNFMANKTLQDHIFWYYTPMALEFSRKHDPELLVFDCMDELSAFKFAHEKLVTLEKELLKKADIVFTGGHAIFQAKKAMHTNIHPFPSSIDKEHFGKARKIKKEGGKPTLGFFGVIDERFDIDIVAGIADARPGWQISLLGPVVKIDPSILPKNKNIRYHGPKPYNELPALLAEWDIALIPFLLNESTNFISPTKTPEYLAGGKPVISTPIRDVIHPYGTNKLVHIGRNAADFIELAEAELATKKKDQWLQNVDSFLSHNSWDKVVGDMLRLMIETLDDKYNTSIAQ